MRKVIVSMMMSADGYVQDKNGGLDWLNWDDEMEAYMTEFMHGADLLLYGRKSYELMIQYWPNASGPFADIMNGKEKIVFSTTLKEATWNSRLVKEDVAGEIHRLKQQPGKNIVLFAGPTLLAELTKHTLVDEYRLITNPVVLGAGLPVFTNSSKQLDLVHTATQNFNCGNVLLVYEPRDAKKWLLQTFRDATKEICDNLSAVDEELVNQVPFADSWTAGQVGEHILKSVSGMRSLLMDGVVPTSRAKDEKLASIRNVFLDYHIKLKSPDFIIPSEGPLDKATLLEGLRKSFDVIEAIATTEDLSVDCTTFPLPQWGILTRFEWVYFVACHTKRHARQIRNINHALEAKK